MKEKLNMGKELLKDYAFEIVAISGYIGVLPTYVPLYKWMCAASLTELQAIAGGNRVGLKG